MDKSAKIHAEDVDIAVKAVSGEDYISLTDMARHAGAVPGDVIRRWLRLSDTIQFLSAWERMSNPNFDHNAARQLLGKSGRNIFSLSTVEWVSSIKAIGVRASRERIEYASEADLINLAVFGQKASTWKKDHPGWGGNMRDYAPVSDLVILQNIEAYSSVLITQGFSKQERFEKMLIEVRRQRESLKTEIRSVEKLRQMLDSSAGNNDVHCAIGE